MTRIALIICLAIAFAVELRAARPNIVLVVADDLSPDAGCYGNPVIQTPNIDALAADGIRFDQAFCTTASCSASRSVILSGLHNHANGQYGHTHSYHHFRSYQQLKTLPVLLSQAGYRTARAGKYHVAPEEVYRFDVAIKGSARSPVVMADNCRQFLQSDDDSPFFLYFCTSDPHRGGGYGDAPYRPNLFGNRDEGYPGVTPLKVSPSDVIVPPFLPDTPVCRAELAEYYQSVARVDQGLGQLVQVLRETGHYDNTFIVFTSDHGMAFPGAKTNVYEPALRIPFIVRPVETLERGVASLAMVSLVDLTPTLLALADGLPAGQAFHGRSFLPVIDDPDIDGWDEIYASHTFHEIQMYYPMRVIRQRRYKLIWNIAHQLPYPFASDLWAAPTWQDRYRQGPDTTYGKRTVGQYIHRDQFELYDLRTDPHETENLANETRHSALLAMLQQRMKEFQRRTDDPWIMKWDYE